MPAKKRKVTSSRTRSTRTASKRPTSSKTRATRSKASTNSSRITRSGQKSGTGAKRVTRGRGGRSLSALARKVKGAGLLSKLGKVGAGLVGMAATEAAFPARAADGTLKGKVSRPNTQKPKAKPLSLIHI